MIKEENKRLKMDKNDIIIGQQKFTSGQYLQSELLLHVRPFPFNAHYMLRKDTSGKIKAMFLGPPDKNRPKQI
jgi:hypothetical protein